MPFFLAHRAHHRTRSKIKRIRSIHHGHAVMATYNRVKPIIYGRNGRRMSMRIINVSNVVMLVNEKWLSATEALILSGAVRLGLIYRIQHSLYGIA